MTSETEAMIEKAEYWDWAMDNWLMAESLIAALRAAETRNDVFEAELEELLEFAHALKRVADLSEKWSDSLVQQINEIARRALDGKSRDYTEALRAADERERELRKALEPFSEAARLALPSGRPPWEFCAAQDYQAARQALRGKS